MKRIEEFTGEYQCLSRDWPIPIEFEGFIYPTLQHAYEASKTFDNQYLRKKIRNMPTPAQARQCAQTEIEAKGLLRKDWNKERFVILTSLIRQKFFFKEILLTQKLIQTEDAFLIDCNAWGDQFLDQKKNPAGHLVGSNYSGQIHMDTRKQLLDRKKFLTESLNKHSGLKDIHLAKVLNLSEWELFVQRTTFGL